MPSGSALALFLVAAVVVLVVPGPAVVYVATRAMAQGRAVGLASVLGIATGSLVHVAGAAAGLSAVLAASVATFNAVKLAGAAYLVVLGIRRIRRAGRDEEEPGRPVGARRAYLQGIVVQTLNPKAALFILAFIPQFVDPAGNVALEIAVLGTLFTLLGLCTDSAWALLANAAGSWLRRRPVFRRRSDQVAGTIFVGLGLTAALAGHSATTRPRT